MSYSPDGKILAIGGRDWFLYLYKTEGKYPLISRISGSTSAFLSFDWSLRLNLCKIKYSSLLNNVFQCQ